MVQGGLSSKDGGKLYSICFFWLKIEMANYCVKAQDGCMCHLFVDVMSHFTPCSICTFHPSRCMSFHVSHPAYDISSPFHAALGFCASPQCSKADRIKDVPDLRLAPPRGSMSNRKGVPDLRLAPPQGREVYPKDAPDLRLKPPQGSTLAIRTKGALYSELSSQYKPEIKSEYKAEMKSETTAERQYDGDAEGKLEIEDGDTQEARYEGNCESNKRDHKEGNVKDNGEGSKRRDMEDVDKESCDKDAGLVNNVSSGCHEHARKVSKLRSLRVNIMNRRRVMNWKAVGVLKARKQTCCSRSQVLECVIEYCHEKKISKPNTKKMRRNERKKIFQRHKNGKVVEIRMSKEKRQKCEKAQKNIESHTRRSLSYVVNNMQAKTVLQRKKHHRHTSCKKSASEPGKQNRRGRIFCKNQNIGDTVRCTQKNKGSSQCWVCDQKTGPEKRAVECGGCNAVYHVNCMGFSKVRLCFVNKPVSWMCCKCGKCNYTVSLFYDFAIPTDESIFEILSNLEEGESLAEDLKVNATEGEAQIDVRMIHDVGVEEVTSTYACLAVATKQSLVQQTGGYNLRNKKNKDKHDGNDIKESQGRRDKNNGKVAFDTKCNLGCTLPSRNAQVFVNKTDGDENKTAKRRIEENVENVSEGTVTKKRCMKNKEMKHKNCEFKRSLARNVDDNVVVADNRSVKYQSKEMLEVKTITQLRQLDETIFAQGSFHQGDQRFGVHRGKQCVANSLVSIMYCMKKEVKDWKCGDIDNILRTGNELYGFLQESSMMNNDYLLINELPTELDVFDTHYSMEYHESVSGTFDENAHNLNEFNMLPLRATLQQHLQEYHACFISFNGNTFAVIAQDGTFYVFDSHSRSTQGCMVQDGTSIVMKARTWQETMIE
ncbi:uncharacterized protein [Asterias amurensis]|uniref:uncharacterized protein n=1 Tax=Asterias amurensis TaxID=7602 RepID=UPI003AB822F8